MKKIYGIPPPPPEEHHEAINDVNNILQGMQTQIYNLEGLTQTNADLTISDSAVMAQLEQRTVTMNAMQV